MRDLENRLRLAVQFFWETRLQQKAKQKAGGKKDQGNRGAATGGSHLDGISALAADLLTEAGVPEGAIFRRSDLQLPGFFRPTKDWDLLVIIDGHLLASIEFKSHVGPSFGNNYNNRTEEALGNATDLWTAYREGAFRPSPRPWLGYFMLLEEAKKSTTPVKVREPHFRVLKEFQGASYANRYETLCRKLVRERLYDGACLLLSPRGDDGGYDEPDKEMSFRAFMASVIGHCIGFLGTRE